MTLAQRSCQIFCGTWEISLGGPTRWANCAVGHRPIFKNAQNRVKTAQNCARNVRLRTLGIAKRFKKGVFSANVPVCAPYNRYNYPILPQIKAYLARKIICRPFSDVGYY